MNEIIDIFRSFSPFIASEPTAATFVKVSKQFLSVVDDDTDRLLLRRISSDLSKLLRGYLKAGRSHLDDALQSSSPEKRENYLHQARESFVMAAEVDYSPDNARAMEYVGVCHDLFGDGDLAKKWYVKAYNTLRNEHSHLVEWLKEFEKDSSQAGRVGIDIVKSLLIVPLLFDAAKNIAHGDIAEDDRKRKHLAKLLEAFTIEIQMRHLVIVLNRRGISLEPHNPLYFPLEVTEIYRAERSGYKNIRVLLLMGYSESGPCFQVHLGWGDETKEAKSGKVEWGD